MRQRPADAAHDSGFNSVVACKLSHGCADVKEVEAGCGLVLGPAYMHVAFSHAHSCLQPGMKGSNVSACFLAVLLVYTHTLGSSAAACYMVVAMGCQWCCEMQQPRR
jgi:hypothetical protein